MPCPFSDHDVVVLDLSIPEPIPRGLLMIFGWAKGFANLLSLHSRIGGIARGRSLSILHFNIEVGRAMIVAFLVLSVYETVFAPLAAIDLTEAEGARVRSLVKWAEEGETSSRYFFAIGEGAWS